MAQRKSGTSATRQRDLKADLREFASARPAGWDHEDWLTFLEHLREKGHETGDSEAIGRALEKERLALALEKVPGVGPRRVETLVDRFETLWSLRRAEVDTIAELPNIPRSLAETIKREVR